METVNAVLIGASLRATMGSRCSRCVVLRRIGVHRMPLVWRIMKATFSGSALAPP